MLCIYYRDVMSQSYGEGYATRCGYDGFGGTCGRNEPDPKSHEDHSTYIHENHPGKLYLCICIYFFYIYSQFCKAYISLNRFNSLLSVVILCSLWSCSWIYLCYWIWLVFVWRVWQDSGEWSEGEREGPSSDRW